MPLPNQSFKPETKKFQSSKIAPSDLGQSKKMGENYQGKISPSSPEGTFRKRLAFEDLTNAFQSQLVQSKKEANKGFVKDVPKMINRSKHVLELDKYNEMNKKRSKLELSRVVASTPSVSNISEKPLLLDISTNFQTPAPEEVSFAKKPILLKEPPSTEETTLLKKPLKKYTNPREASLLERSLSLLEETDCDDEFVKEPVTFGKKHKPKEAAITKKTLSLKKMHTYQGKQLCLEEPVTLQDSDVEEGSFSMELMNLREKPKIQESSSTKKPLPLSSKCTSMEKVSNTIKSALLQKITSEEELVTKEPPAFMRTTNKESFSWQPSALKEKHTTEQEISISKKSLTLQEKTDFKDSSLSKELRTFKQKPATEEEERPVSPVFRKEICYFQGKMCLTHRKECTIYGKMPYIKKPLVQEVTSGEKSLNTKPLSLKRSLITEFYQEPSALQEKHTTQAEVGLLKRPRTLQENVNSEASFVMEAPSCKKQHTTMEASHTKKPLPLKKKQKIQSRLSRYKPIIFQRVTYGEDSSTKEPLSFEMSTSEEDSLSQEPSTSQAKDSIPEEVSPLKKPVALQKSPTEKELHFQQSLAFQKQCTIKKGTPSKKPLPLKKQQHVTQGTASHLKKPSVLQTPEEKSSVKKPLSFNEENMSLKKKRNTTQTIPQWIDLSDWPDICLKNKKSFTKPVSSTKKCRTEKAVLTKTPTSSKEKQTTQRKITSEQESPSKKLLPFNKEPTAKEESLFQEQPASKEKHATFQEVSLSREPIALQMKTTTKEDSDSKEPVTLKETPVTEEDFFSPELFSPEIESTNSDDESLFQEDVALQEETDTKTHSLKKQLTLHDKSTMTEESFFSQFSVLKKEPSPKAATSTERKLPIKDKPTAQGQAFLSKEQLALHENITIDEGVLKPLPTAGVGSEKAVFQEPLTMQERLSTRKEAVLKEHTTDTEAHFKELSAMQEKPCIEKELIFQKLLNLQEKPMVKEGTIFTEPFALQEKVGLESEAMVKELLALQEKPSPKMEANLKEPLALQEKSTTENELSFQEPFTLEPHVSNNAVESRTGKFSAANTSSMGKSSESESGSNIPFAPQSRMQKQMTILEDIDKARHDPVYASEIFSYLKDREVCR